MYYISHIIVTLIKFENRTYYINYHITKDYFSINDIWSHISIITIFIIIFNPSRLLTRAVKNT